MGDKKWYCAIMHQTSVDNIDIYVFAFITYPWKLWEYQYIFNNIIPQYAMTQYNIPDKGKNFMVLYKILTDIHKTFF